jgi:uncharacterized protein (TIGR03118 family)
MEHPHRCHRSLTRGPVRALPALVLALVALACANDINGPGYAQTNLVSNVSGKAMFTDPNLVNAWGIAHGPNGPWAVANNGTGVSTSYDGDGTSVGTPLVVTIPPPAGSPPGTASAPTGVVFNLTTDFVVAQGAAAAPAQLIFATEDGTIAGWSAVVNPGTAILAVDNSSGRAIYKGLATGNNATSSLIFATDFHNRAVDAFDGTFTPVALSGTFTDPNIPARFAPFGIQNVNGNIFVTYALQDADMVDDVPGPGNGYVSVFDTDGNFVRRFATQGNLNSPWGVALAPISFGRFGGALIIGNFGDGQLNAFSPVGATFLGQVNRPNGNPITIPGLWGLGFGNGGSAGSAQTLYFASGPDAEKDGLFGMLQPVNG